MHCMAQAKKMVHLVKYQAENGETGGQRFNEEQRANDAAAALKRTGHKKVANRDTAWNLYKISQKG